MAHIANACNTTRQEQMRQAYGLGQRDAQKNDADAPGLYGLGQRDAQKKTSCFEGSNPSRALLVDGEDSDDPEAKSALNNQL